MLSSASAAWVGAQGLVSGGGCGDVAIIQFGAVPGAAWAGWKVCGGSQHYMHPLIDGGIFFLW